MSDKDKEEGPDRWTGVTFHPPHRPLLSLQKDMMFSVASNNNSGRAIVRSLLTSQEIFCFWVLYYPPPKSGYGPRVEGQ